jgi:hypothetical protein
MRGIVARSPFAEGGLKLLLESAEREPTPAEEAVALPFRPTE